MFESVLLPAASLWRREMVRFFRQRSRVTGSLATPLMFWLLFSAGYGPAFGPAAGGEGGAFAFFLPGTLALILLFTSIFANISIIEDRKEGFLQGVLAAPVSRLGIVLGKVLGGATIAVIQGLLFLLLAAVTGVGLEISVGPAVAAVVVLAVAMTALGFVFAWTMDTVQAFHGIMNLVLMPLWLLSGSLFPTDGTAAALRAIVLANPVTYGLATLRHALGVPSPDVPSAAIAWAVSASFAAILVILALSVALRPERGTRPGRTGRDSS